MGSEKGVEVWRSQAADTYRIQKETERRRTWRARSTSRRHGSPTGTSSAQLLRDHGLEAEPIDELGIKVPYGDNEPEKGDEILAYVEGVVMDLGAQMIPIKHEGVIYIRPPVG